MFRRPVGSALMWLCAVVDLVPWRDSGKWCLRGQCGCAWGISNFANKVYGD